ncbi:MAG: LLM class oxidoreductase [Cyclobacteriaceae bacterium]
MKHFEEINRGFNRIFQPDKLSIGLVIPLENYAHGPVPTMQDHLERVKLAEALGFKALWTRDIPYNVPSFGDAGQMFDPFTYLGYLAAHTSEIVLGISSIALPLHHPLHVAKAATSIDQLSDGRMIMGVASGDRPDEYPAMGIEFEKREELFREAFQYIRGVQADFPILENNYYGHLTGHMDMLPKPHSHKIPMLITGSSRQTLEWNASNADGWMNYPRNLYQQQDTLRQWRELIAQDFDHDKPFMQPLYVVLQENDDTRPQPIPLGFSIGANYLLDYLYQLEDMGVNHVAINLRFNKMPMEATLHKLAEKVLNQIHTKEKALQS